MPQNNTLIVYYSRSGITKKIAEKMNASLGGDIEQIKCDEYDKSFIGFWKFLFSKKQKVILQSIKHDPSKYDLIIVGSPTCHSNAANPIITYLENNNNNIKNIAFFSTHGFPKEQNTLEDMKKSINKNPLMVIDFNRTIVHNSNFDKIISEFIIKIKSVI